MFKTQWNAKRTVIQFIEENLQEEVRLFPDHYENNSPISETIPDQTLSVEQILKNHARGLGNNMGMVPIFNGDDQLENELASISPKHDLAARQEFLEKKLDELNEIKARLAAKAEEVKQRSKRSQKALEEPLKPQSGDSGDGITEIPFDEK